MVSHPPPKRPIGHLPAALGGQLNSEWNHSGTCSTDLNWRSVRTICSSPAWGYFLAPSSVSFQGSAEQAAWPFCCLSRSSCRRLRRLFFYLVSIGARSSAGRLRQSSLTFLENRGRLLLCSTATPWRSQDTPGSLWARPLCQVFLPP